MTQWLEHVPLFQKGQIPFPAPISGGTQLPIIPVPGDLKPSLVFEDTVHMCTNLTQIPTHN